MPDALETRLTRAGGRLPEPPRDATARARAAALAALPAPPRRRTWARPLRVTGALAGAGALAALIAALIVATPSGTDEAPPTSLRPDVATLGEVSACAHPADLAVPCVEGAQATRAATPAIDGAPWLARGAAHLARRPSLVFPPGTTYAGALDALLVSVTLTGGLPPGATLGAPLPGRAVLLRPTDPAAGIAIDLRAPFGYAASGRVQRPTLVADASAPASPTGLVWPAGTRVTVPRLPPCLVAADRATAPPPCRPGEVGRASTARAPELPRVPLLPARVDEVLGVLRPGGVLPPPGSPFALASLRGRVVVLAFFASWCEPCAHQAGALRRLAARYAGDADVIMIGVAVRDRPGPAAGFLRRHRLDLPVLRAFHEIVGVTAVPETVVVDREGRVASRIRGALTSPAQVERRVERVR